MADVAPDQPCSVKMQAMCPVDMVVGQVFSSVSNTGVIQEDFVVTNRGADSKVAVVFEPINWTESSVRRIAPTDIVASWITNFVPHAKVLETQVWDFPQTSPGKPLKRSDSQPATKLWSVSKSKDTVRFLPEVVQDEELGQSNSALHKHAEHLMESPALGQHTYLEPLSADQDGQCVGLARFAMHSAPKIRKTLDVFHGGNEFYTVEGRAVLRLNPYIF